MEQMARGQDMVNLGIPPHKVQNLRDLHQRHTVHRLMYPTTQTEFYGTSHECGGG